MAENIARRRFLKKSICASFTAGLPFSFEEKAILAAASSRKKSEAGHPTTSNEIPKGKIKNVRMSRLICGGNLIGGVAHSRDLIYLSELVDTYFTDKKIVETWQLCEENGIDTMSAWPKPKLFRALKKYRSDIGGHIQWLGHIGIDKDFTKIKTCIDGGAVAIYIAGDVVDLCVKNEKFDLLNDALNVIKDNGLPAGIACHAIKVPVILEQQGIDVDFYMKTIHTDQYWSATPKEQRTVDVRIWDPNFVKGQHTSGHYHDNIWSLDPDATIKFMNTCKKPWIGFKVLAAGAIRADQGFKYAFEAGADFIHVGMFDFQVTEDAFLTRRILNSKLKRNRPWRA